MVTTHGFLLIFKIQCVWPWIGGDTWNRKTGAGLNVRNLWSNTGRAALVTLLSHSYIYVLLLFFSCQSCLTLCHPMDHSMPGFPVLHYLLEFAQVYVHELELGLLTPSSGSSVLWHMMSGKESHFNCRKTSLPQLMMGNNSQWLQAFFLLIFPLKNFRCCSRRKGNMELQ